MNSVNLIGRITKDIELKTTESGMVATSMFIAINNGKNENVWNACKCWSD